MAAAVQEPLAEVTNSPMGGRAGDKSSPKPVRQNTIGLEEEMAMLLAGADALGEGAKAANKDCLRVKRRSREVSAELGDIADEVKSKAGAAKIWRSLGMPGGDKVDLSDSALREAFNKIDIDGSGGLDQEELAIVRALPRPTHAGLAARTHAARGGTRCYFSPVVLFLLFRSLTMLGSISRRSCVRRPSRWRIRTRRRTRLRCCSLTPTRMAMATSTSTSTARLCATSRIEKNSPLSLLSIVPLCRERGVYCEAELSRVL